MQILSQTTDGGDPGGVIDRGSDSGSLSTLSEIEEDNANSTTQAPSTTHVPLPDGVSETRSPSDNATAGIDTCSNQIESLSGDHALNGPESSSSAGGDVSIKLAQGPSSYRDFLGKFSLSPTSTEQASATTPAEIAVSLFTPIGSRLTYYSNPLSWNLFRPDSVSPTRISTEPDVVQTLYLNSSYANKRSVMLLEDPKYIKTQGKKMFSHTPDPKRADFAHVLLQVVVLDRLVWCSLPRKTSSIRRNPDRPKKEDLPENARSLLTSCQDWRSLLAQAATQCLTYDKLQNEPDPEIARTATSLDPDDAIVSLSMRLAQSKNDVIVNHIEQNFIAAAIALRALAEVSTIFPDLLPILISHFSSFFRFSDISSLKRISRKIV